MGMVKLWPLIESEPLTDYDKTLYNWLRPRDEHVTQNLCQSAVRERLAKYVKYKASCLFLLLFFPGLAYWSNPCMEFNARCLKHALWRKEVPFWGPHDGRQHFVVQIPQKPSKMAFYKQVRASTNGLETNDVIEDWRHWLAVARSRPSSVGRILFIASGKILQLCILQYLQRNDFQLVHYIRYGNSVFAKFIQYL